MIRLPPRSTRTDTLFPYTTLFRSGARTHADAVQGGRRVRLVFIHGAAASGKLTVARELAALTGLPLFHNHLVVDALLAVFPFGSPGFVLLRETMWMDVFRAAAAEEIGKRRVGKEGVSTCRSRWSQYP